MQELVKLGEKEKDLVFMQNEFQIKSKEGKITDKKIDLVVFGNHNGLPYSATALLVSLPASVAAQVIIMLII